MAGRRGRLWIGTSGYQYEHWRGRFYPRRLPAHQWLRHYSAHFDAVEINATFYRLPEARTFDAWREQTPEGFCFALKFSRYGSHLKRLQQPRAAIAKFVRRARRLGERLGPILVQLPPRWQPEPGRLARFLRAAPRELRWAVELRDPRWLCEEVYRALRERDAALCIHDLLPDHPRERTAAWTYLRFHGTGPGHSGSYSSQRLVAHARRIQRDLADGLDVYAFFNNDPDAHAPADARRLARYVTGRGGGSDPGG